MICSIKITRSFYVSNSQPPIPRSLLGCIVTLYLMQVIMCYSVCLVRIPPKSYPFLSTWLVCTLVSTKIINKLYYHTLTPQAVFKRLYWSSTVPQRQSRLRHQGFRVSLTLREPARTHSAVLTFHSKYLLRARVSNTYPL